MKVAIDRQMNRLLQQGAQHSQWNSRNNIRDSGFAHHTEPLPRAAERPGPDSARLANKPLTGDDLAWRAERALLYSLLQYPGLLARITAELGDTPFSDPLHRRVYQVAVAACRSSNAIAGPIVARVLDMLSDPDARLVVTEMAANPLVSADSEQEADHCIEKIQQHRVSRRIEDLENLMKSQQAAGQPVDHAVVQAYTQLQLQRKKPSKS